jgi:uncharacterized protein YecT (DUF1311 family)
MRLHRSLAAGCGAAALALCVIAPASAGAASSASPPVIHEQFTLLACPKKPTTTVQIEGCAEHKIVATDKTIDALNAKIFAKLGKAGRAGFIQASTDWLKYRDEACTAETSIYSGGSIQPVAYADCLVSIDGSHVTELKAMLLALSPEG